MVLVQIFLNQVAPQKNKNLDEKKITDHIKGSVREKWKGV